MELGLATKQNANIKASKQDRRRFWKKVKGQKFLLIIVIPAMLWYIVFCYLPMFGLLGAFEDFVPAKGYFKSAWVGLKWFEMFLTGYHFPVLLKNTVCLTGLKILIGFPAPIILALLLNEMRNGWYKKTAQTISYLPYFVSWVTVLGIFGRLLSPDGGVVNNLLHSFFGVKEPIAFLSQSQYIWPVAIITEIWKGVGWGTIIYLATLTSINPELYEAARIDGAGRWKQTLFITLPGLKPTIAILFTLNMGALVSGNFEQLWILGTAPVRDVTDIFDTYIARAGLLEAQYSLATAAGLMMSIVAFGLVWTTNRIVKLMGEEGLW